MDAWTLILMIGIFAVNFDVQSEDACAIVAKRLTEHYWSSAECVNTFDGTILYFEKGKQL